MWNVKYNIFSWRRLFLQEWFKIDFNLHFLQFLYIFFFDMIAYPNLHHFVNFLMDVTDDIRTLMLGET